MRKYTIVTPEIEQRVLELFKTNTNLEIASILDIPKQRVRMIYRRNGLRRTDGDGRIKPGSTPPNKGKKMTPEQMEKYKHTFFQKGHLPHNTKKDGEISRRSCGYQFIRISLSEWEFLHRYNWMQKHGEIPKGMNVAFVDGNRDNCSINNLELVSDAVLAERNRLSNYPAELQGAIKSLNKLNKQLKNYGKK